MRLHNSSTSNSKSISTADLSKSQALSLRSHTTVSSIVKTGIYTLLSLVALDVAIGVLFRYPTDPLNTNPGNLNLYFDYGRSLESKVFRQLGKTDEQSALIAQAGWLNDAGKGEPTQPQAGSDILVALYGMSFSSHVGDALQKLDPKITTRMIAAPYAPPNHSFAAYQRDRSALPARGRSQHSAKVVILGILASGVQGLDSMTGLTLGGEVPAPYTFPQYDIVNGQLQPVLPQIQTLTQLRAARDNPQQWQAFVDQLAERDRFYNPLTFQHNFIDQSAILRIARRSWAKQYRDQVSQSIHTPAGFNPQWRQIPVLQKMVEEFAAEAKQDGALPIVLLIQDQGYDDHLYKILQPTLEQTGITAVSTHTIASATDRQNFVPDGHFTTTANQRIATKVLEVINQRLGR
jgi:hypothetical protein